MKRRIMALAMSVLCILLPTTVFAQPTPSTDYDLKPESRFSEGCLEPCLCPIWSAEELRGSFGLHYAGIDGSFDVYNIFDVVWEYSFGGETVLVRGLGTYRVNSEERVQQLELELELGEDAFEHYDSGLVPLVEELPKITIAIAMNEFYCWDRVFEIVAMPTTAIPTPEATWGMVKARHGN